MAILKCKMCGGDLSIQDGMTVAECEYCGTKQTVPTADNEKKMTLFARANRLRAACEFDKAAGIYENIIADFPEEAEAYWGLVLCKFGIEYVDDPATGKKIPTCHRSSFDSIMDDDDFEQVMENADSIARRVYREEAKAIEEIRKGIIEVSSKEEPYDIFICYKETDENGERTIDSVIAQDIYKELSNEGYRVFFARISLEDKLGTAYEPYIFAALNSAKVMLAVGTDYDYYNAVWVKNEWSRFLALIAKGEKKTLIPCYKDIDAYDIPREFKHLQAQDMGKVGAMQDLMRGVGKILGAKKQNVPSTNVVDSNVSAMIQRGNMALEDGDFQNAVSFFERALDSNPKAAHAYLGKFLAFHRLTSLRDLQDKVCYLENNKEYKRAEQFSDPELAKELKAIRESNELKIQRLRFLDVIRKGLKQAEIKEKRAAEIEEKYIKACSLQDSAEEDQLVTAIDIFKELTDYKNSSERLTVCEQAYKEKKEGREEREEHERAERIKRLAPIRKRLSPYRNLILAGPVGLKEDGTVVAVGSNNYGECDVADWKDIVSVAVGCCRTIGLKADGTVESAGSFGDNGYRSSDNRYREDKTELSSWRNIKAIVTTDHRVIGLKTDGTVVTVGHYLYGGDTSYWRDIIAVAATHNHTVGLKSDGTVEAVGDNKHGQCNVEDWSDIVAIAAGYYHTVGLKSNGTVVATKFWDYGYTKHEGQCDVSDWTDIVEIVTGDSFTAGLKSDGTVVATGRYNSDVKHWKEIVSIYSGDYRIVGIKSDGTVVSTGNNHYGECNLSNWHDIVAVAVSDYRTYGLKADGTVVTAGASVDGECNVSDWKLFKSDTEKYTEACRLQDSGLENNLEKAADLFAGLKNYKDSSQRAITCRQAYKEKKFLRERTEKSSRLNAEKSNLQTDLANLKGIFSGKRRKQIEARLAEIESELKIL